jgi:nucleoside-diphosphate-sugar epimerase
MKALVTGGTGFLGKHLVKTLRQKNHYCRCLVRKTSNAKELERLGVDLVFGDITNFGSLDGITQGIDVVYHLAAQMGKWGIPDDKFYAINVQGTMNLLEATSYSDVKQFIFCSTPGVLGKGDAQALETMPYNPPYIYEKTKCEAEKLVIEFHRKNNLPVTIIRPDFVYGPGDLRRVRLYKAIRDKKFYIIGTGKFFLHPTYCDDAIQGFLDVSGNPVAYGQVYNIAGPCLISVQEFIETIAQIVNVSIPRFKIPKFFAISSAYAFELFSKINRNEPLISRSKIEFLTNNHGSNISKAQSQIGFRPIYSLYAGMKNTIDWCYKHGLL